MYTEAAAARLMRVAPSTLHWWLEGRSPRYRPVIRPEPTGARTVTWAEFVEAGLLRSYRRDHEVPLKELRDLSISSGTNSRCRTRWRTSAHTSVLVANC